MAIGVLPEAGREGGRRGAAFALPAFGALSFCCRLHFVACIVRFAPASPCGVVWCGGAGRGGAGRAWYRSVGFFVAAGRCAMYSESGGAGDASLFAGGGFMPSQSATGNEFSSSVTGASRVRFAAAYCFRGFKPVDRACMRFSHFPC